MSEGHIEDSVSLITVMQVPYYYSTHSVKKLCQLTHRFKQRKVFQTSGGADGLVAHAKLKV